MARQRNEERSADILEAAGRLFLEHGYAGMSVSMLTEAAGCSRATVYSRFESKEALFRSWITHRARKEAETLFGMLKSGDAPEKTLFDVGRHFLLMSTSPANIAFSRLLHSESPRFPELGKAFHDLCLLPGRRLMIEYLARLEGQNGFSFPDPALAVEQFFALCLTRHKERALLGVRGSVDEAEAEVSVRAAVAVFLGAYKTR